MSSNAGKDTQEPRGFGEHTRGLSGEYAHEQGWGLDVAERTRTEGGPKDTDGGKDYEYGARDFGDEPVNTARATPGPGGEDTARRALGIDEQRSTTDEQRSTTEER